MHDLHSQLKYTGYKNREEKKQKSAKTLRECIFGKFSRLYTSIQSRELPQRDAHNQEVRKKIECQHEPEFFIHPFCCEECNEKKGG